MAAGYLSAYQLLLETSAMPQSAVAAANAPGVLPWGERRARTWPMPAGAQSRL
jgi:hypothetical protein